MPNKERDKNKSISKIESGYNPVNANIFNQNQLHENEKFTISNNDKNLNKSNNLENDIFDTSVKGANSIKIPKINVNEQVRSQVNHLNQNNNQKPINISNYNSIPNQKAEINIKLSSPYLFEDKILKNEDKSTSYNGKVIELKKEFTNLFGTEFLSDNIVRSDSNNNPNMARLNKYENNNKSKHEETYTVTHNKSIGINIGIDSNRTVSKTKYTTIPTEKFELNVGTNKNRISTKREKGISFHDVPINYVKDQIKSFKHQIEKDNFSFKQSKSLYEINQPHSMMLTTTANNTAKNNTNSIDYLSNWSSNPNSITYSNNSKSKDKFSAMLINPNLENNNKVNNKSSMITQSKSKNYLNISTSNKDVNLYTDKSKKMMGDLSSLNTISIGNHKNVSDGTFNNNYKVEEVRDLISILKHTNEKDLKRINLW